MRPTTDRFPLSPCGELFQADPQRFDRFSVRFQDTILLDYSKNRITGETLDLLVEFCAGHVPGLFGLVRMQATLSEMLGRAVDLRTAEDLSRYFREEIVRTAQVQYEA